MEVNSYYDFAEQDAKYFLKDCNEGRVANYLASMAQSICERYMKHIISEYYEPESQNEANNKVAILRTHNLNKLIDFLTEEMRLNIPDDKADIIEKANGYYFTTRYPGEDSFFVSQRDMKKCEEAVKACKEEIDRIISEFQQTKEGSSLFEQIVDGAVSGDIYITNASEKKYEDI